MNLSPFDKLIITRFNGQINAKVIGVIPAPDGSNTYILQSLLKDFTASKSGSRIIRITSTDIENQTIKIQKHTV